MRIVFISDTHQRHNDIRLNVTLRSAFESNPDTVLVHCGDVCSRGTKSEAQSFLEWYSLLPFKSKIFIAGNHDFFFENNDEEVHQVLEKFPDLIYLNDSGVEIAGTKFWGSPVQPRFYDWAFNRDNDISKHWDLIPDDTDVLITHGPPRGILDWTKRDKINVGCPKLLERIGQLNLKVHAFGHIHEAFGMHPGTNSKSKTVFINASYLDLSYIPTNYPLIINI